ncbi:MAG: sulfonate ABC transporter [Acidilobaceae archaeon]|jgi:alpha-aminoadipate carrier protein LysW
MKSRCPICGREALLPDDVMPGEVIEHDCGVTLEVVIDGSTALLKPLEIGEDWGE